MAPAPSPLDVLCVIAEPTRLRLLNCLAAAPLFVSDLQAVLDVPQPTVSRHLALLREAGVVYDTPIGPYVLYRLSTDRPPAGRLVRAVLEGLLSDDRMRSERRKARELSRTRTDSPRQAASRPA